MIRETLYRASSLDPGVLHDLLHVHGRHVGDFADRPIHGGTHDGVSYRTAWATNRADGHMGYDIPPTWRYRDPADTRTFADRIGEHE